MPQGYALRKRFAASAEYVVSNDKTVAPDNGLGGWNMGWKEWKAGS